MSRSYFHCSTSWAWLEGGAPLLLVNTFAFLKLVLSDSVSWYLEDPFQVVDSRLKRQVYGVASHAVPLSSVVLLSPSPPSYISPWLCLFSVLAIPSVPAEQDLTVNVFNDEPAILTCPIPLGNLYNHLDPYTFFWEEAPEHAVLIPLHPSLVPQRYSNNNRSLTVFVNDTTRSNSYRCGLRLRRCDIISTDSIPYCPEMTYFGPITRLRVFGKDILYAGNRAW